MKRIISSLLILILLTIPSMAEESSGFLGGLGDMAGKAWDNTKSWVGNAASDVGDAASQAWDSTSNWVSGAASDVGDALSQAWSAIRSKGQDVTEETADADVLPEPDIQPKTYLETLLVNTGKDNGYSGASEIDLDDPHFGWKMGDFYISGYSGITYDEDGNPIFLKNVGDSVEFHFELYRSIVKLNGNENLSVSEDTNGYDQHFGIAKTNLGRGALIVRQTDYQNHTNEPQLYTDYLASKAAGTADTVITLNEEGDYEVALDYELQQKSTFLNSYSNYRIYSKFSVRNGNCMIFPFDVVTGAELSDSSVTENGFRLDLARSRYLDINIKRSVLTEGAAGLTEDQRFNRPAQDGEEYTQEGIYTITVKNRYTDEETVKQIFVGSSDLLDAYIANGLTLQ